MNLIAASEIRVLENRIRRTFSLEDLQELKRSILTIGLLHPPVLRSQNGVFTLVAGERRLRALRSIYEDGLQFKHDGAQVPRDQVPYVAFEELSEIEALEVELEENIIRVDISWQERVSALAQLHELKKSQNPNWTKVDTIALANTPNKNVTAFTKSLIVAEHLNDPAIASAKNEREAAKLLARKLENQFRAQLAALGPEESKHTLLVGEAIEQMSSLPDHSFDVILTDPPYGINAQDFDADMVVTHDYADDWEQVRALLQRCAYEFYRLAKPQAHLYLFCAVERFYEIKAIIETAGWDVWKRPLIWVKDVGHTAQVDFGPAYYYECILYANKGRRPVVHKATDVLQIPAVKHKSHAAQKPVELYTNLLSRSVLRGHDRILDPFCGSGTIFPAANRLGLTATGVEMDLAAAGIATERLNAKE